MISTSLKHLSFSAALVLAPILAACSTTMPQADTALAVDVMRVLSDDAMEGRAAGTEGNARAREYIADTAATLNDGVAPQRHAFTRAVTRRGGETVDVSGVNLITIVPGRSADNSGPVLEITAHFDHLGVSETGEIYNGADDNASGVGALLAILKSFRADPPKHDVHIVWLDAEEGGLTGAREYVEDRLDDRPRVNLNLDMIAQNEAGVIYAAGTHHTPALRPLVETAAMDVGLNVRFGHDAPQDGANDWTTQSDHAAFHALGIPFLYFGVEDHEHYHRTTDEFHTIPLETYRRAVQLAVNTAHMLDAELATIAQPRTLNPARSTEP